MLLYLSNRLYQIMFGEPRIEDISFEIVNKDKKHKFRQQMVVSQSGQIHYDQLVNRIRENLSLKQDPLLFYYDHEQQIQVLLQNLNENMVHYSLIAPQGIIELRIQQKISDEVMANSTLKQEEVRQKRSPQRNIIQAFQLVLQWREFYTKGTLNQQGQWQKVNLEKAATILNTPRKTLQDYFLLFRQGYAYQFNFSKNRRNKIGTLRAYIKQHKKGQKERQRISRKQEQKLLRKIKMQLSEGTQNYMEEQLFNVISFSSDEDFIKEQCQEQPQN